MNLKKTQQQAIEEFEKRFVVKCNPQWWVDSSGGVEEITEFISQKIEAAYKAKGGENPPLEYSVSAWARVGRERGYFDYCLKLPERKKEGGTEDERLYSLGFNQCLNVIEKLNK